TLLLAMLLRPAEYSEAWEMSKYKGFARHDIALPGEAGTQPVEFEPLASEAIGVPRVLGCYVHVSETTQPLPVEVFNCLEGDQVSEAARRVYLYSRLLPVYGFPVGLDIADKFAKVPQWMTDAYGKLIRYHLGISLQKGEVSDAELRRILVQAIY